jgi:hypothetical protein
VLVVLQVFQPVHARCGDFQPRTDLEPLRGAARGDDAVGDLVQRLDVARALADVGEARVARQVGLARLDEEALPVRVGIGHRAQETVQRLERLAKGVQQARIAGIGQRRREVLAVEVFDQVEGDHRLEHRHFDIRAFTAAFALEERGQDCVRRHQPGGLVGGDGREVLRHAALTFHQAGAT